MSSEKIFPNKLINEKMTANIKKSHRGPILSPTEPLLSQFQQPDKGKSVLIKVNKFSASAQKTKIHKKIVLLQRDTASMISSQIKKYTKKQSIPKQIKLSLIRIRYFKR